MSNINESLLRLYQEYIPGIGRIFDEEKSKDYELDLDGPLLLYCWEEIYERTFFKILFIGQEPNGWLGGIPESVEISTLMGKYKDFGMALGSKKIHTPIWKAIHQINSQLNMDYKFQPCFLWTNISKFCTTDGKPLSYEHFKFTVDNFNLLEKEIEIVNPDVVIFLSGPYYDDRIKLQFTSRTEFLTLIQGIPIRELARVSNPKLPFNSFRVYHPGSLTRQNKLSYLDALVAASSGLDIDFLFESLKRQLEENGFITYGRLGIKDSGFLFKPTNWNFFAIGFEFEQTWGSDFFYGICSSDLLEAIPEHIKSKINVGLESDGEPTPRWPWWKWFSEYRYWNKNALEQIQNGQLIKKILTIKNDLEYHFSAREL